MNDRNQTKTLSTDFYIHKMLIRKRGGSKMNKRMKNKSVVAIVRVEDNDVESSVKKLFELAGGLDTIVAPLDTVLLKPNLAIDKHYSTGAVTNMEVLKACSSCVLKTGAKKIYIGDSSVVGTKTEDVMKINGFETLGGRRVEIVDFKKSEYETVVIPNAYKYRRLPLPKELISSDVVINLPVMKTHEIMEVTLGLKNMKGLLKDTTKKRLHSIGVEEGVIDTNRATLADFTLIDATYGMEGNGPLDGTPVGLNLLIGSKDALAAEVVAITIMGFHAEEMDYIQMAYDAGFGEKEMEHIEVVGEPLETVIHPFQPAFKERKLPNNIRILDEHACSACRNQLNMLMRQHFWSQTDMQETNWCLCSGSVNEEEFNENEIHVGIGKCLYKDKDCFDLYIPGCPPGANRMQREIKTIVAKK